MFKKLFCLLVLHLRFPSWQQICMLAHCSSHVFELRIFYLC
jgi:hypothetical protein